ncbi:MAG TPA: DUF3048 domain-containing protein [Aeromicrobium sp.]|nr:DUF3048 domain-containing protein [Aeromicrobium sp.]
MQFRLLAGIAALALMLGACSSGNDTPTGGASSTPSVDTSVSPLTGLHQGSPPKNAVFMVKIENTANGEPQYGVNDADFVVEELVEGGVTRLAAFFYSELPTRVGHVRSARTTDIDLAEPLDATILASGGAPKTLRKIKKSELPFYSYDMRSPGWSSDPSKHAPYHVLWDLTDLSQTAKASVPPKPYFNWGHGPRRSDVTKRATHASVRFSPATTTNWTFSGNGWRRSPERAAAGEAFTPSTLVVIFAPVKDAGYRDPAGNSVPETVVDGSGRAVIFTGSAATEATWHKENRNATMSFRSKAGKPVTLKPGRVWLEAVPRGGSVTY